MNLKKSFHKTKNIVNIESHDYGYLEGFSN